MSDAEIKLISLGMTAIAAMFVLALIAVAYSLVIAGRESSAHHAREKRLAPPLTQPTKPTEIKDGT